MDEKPISWERVTMICVSIIGTLISVLVIYFYNNQNSINTNLTSSNAQNKTDIADLKGEALKQTAILIVIAEKDGISASEVSQLLSLPATNPTTLNN